MTEPAPRRSRGAQPGNTNALKHGLYTRSFRCLEAARLEGALPGKFEDETELLRVLILRTMSSLKENPPATPKEHLFALRQVTLAVGRLQSMVRTRRASQAVDVALEALLDELRHLPVKEA